ncbi:hypothetical protein ACTFIW_008730 [Dictyostelium discoideum]
MGLWKSNDTPIFNKSLLLNIQRSSKVTTFSRCYTGDESNTTKRWIHVRRNNIAKEIYGFEVLFPIKIKDTPKMFDETETKRVRKLTKPIRKNNEAKQSLLKLNYHSKSNAKKSVNSSGNNTTGNSSNSFKLNLEKSVLRPTQSIRFLGFKIDSVSMKLLVPKEKNKSVIKEIRNFLKLDCCSPRKLAGLKGKIIALKDAVIPFRLYTRRTNKFYSQCLTLANGDWDQSFPIPQDVKSEISHWLTVLNQWNGKEISLFPSYDYVLTTDASESGAGWSDTGPICSVRTTLETMPQEESELDWRAYSRILQCKSRPPQQSFSDESQIIIQSNQELQLATEEGSVQSNPTSIRSNLDGSVLISPEPSNVQLLNNQNECTPPRLESMEAMSGLPTTHSFAFYPGEDELIQFEEDFYNTDLPNLEIINLVSDDSSTNINNKISTTVNNNDASSSSTSASNNAESFDLRMKSMEDQINNLSLAFTRFMKEPMFSSNTNSRSQRTHDDSDTENEQSDDESSNNVDVPTDYQLSDTLLGQYKHMVNNQGLLVEEESLHTLLRL